MMREKLCVFTSIFYDHNNVCQASALSSEEITKIKLVFFVVFFTLNIKCGVINFSQKKRLFELSAFENLL